MAGSGTAEATTQTFSECGNIRPYSELTCQPGRGILRAVIVAGARAATTGPSGRRNNRTFSHRIVDVIVWKAVPSDRRSPHPTSGMVSYGCRMCWLSHTWEWWDASSLGAVGLTLALTWSCHVLRADDSSPTIGEDGSPSPSVKAILKEAAQIASRQDEEQGYWCERRLLRIAELQMRAGDFDGHAIRSRNATTATVRTHLRYIWLKRWLERVITSEHFRSCGRWAPITVGGRTFWTMGSACGGSNTSFPPAISVAQI